MLNVFAHSGIKKLLCKLVLLCAAVALAVNSCAVICCAEQAPLYSDAWLDQRYDWVLYLELNTMKGYLNYPSSQLWPMVSVKVSYRVNPRLAAAGTPNKAVPYEELWYHEGRPIGCRRYTTLPIKKGWQGAVCISPTPDAAVQSPALANSIVRLLLDVSLINNVLTVVLVPPQTTSLISNDLGRFKFFPTKDNSLNGASLIHLFVSSGDPTDRLFLVYRP